MSREEEAMWNLRKDGEKEKEGRTMGGAYEKHALFHSYEKKKGRKKNIMTNDFVAVLLMCKKTGF